MRRTVTVLGLICFIWTGSTLAQMDPYKVAETFMKRRPGPQTNQPPKGKTASQPVYKKVGKIDATGQAVGVTIWRLRQAEIRDNINVATSIRESEMSKLGTKTIRQKVMPDGTKVEIQAANQMRQSDGILRLIPERIGDSTKFEPGDNIRVSVEIPRQNPVYLYIINRETYEDGTYGAPTLIFPTKRMMGGSNLIEAGQVVTLPNKESNPPFFTLERNPEGKGHVGDQLLLLISPTSLTEFDVRDDFYELSREQERFLNTCERTWSEAKGYMDQVNGVGKPMSMAEYQSQASKRMRRGEPLPQRFYIASATEDKPCFVTIPFIFRS